jgi:hypothetical protein
MPSILAYSKPLQAIRHKIQLVDAGLLLTTTDLAKADQTNRLFWGFDEVLFFASNKVLLKANELNIIPVDSVCPQELPSCVDWMNRNDCFLALGDGTELTYIAREPVRSIFLSAVKKLQNSN